MDSQTVDITQLQKAAGQASSFLRSIANKDRLLLLCQLSQCELSVTELADLTGIQQPSLSQQLGVLRREGLIAPRKDGKSVFYRISEPKVLLILQQLYDLFCPEEAIQND